MTNARYSVIERKLNRYMPDEWKIRLTTLDYSKAVDLINAYRSRTHAEDVSWFITVEENV